MTEASKVKVVFDVVVADPLRIDQGVYHSWLRGLTVHEAARRRYDGPTKPAESQVVSLFRDTQDQYRNFHLLRHYLNKPYVLASQPVFQLAPSLQLLLVQRYYDFDDTVARELVGKKLKQSVRKDLDEEFARGDHASLLSCRRQFDNFRHTYKYVVHNEGSVMDHLQNKFLLDKDLAGRYARILFLCFHRCETQKKGLNKLTLPDLEAVASVTMSLWVSLVPVDDVGPLGFGVDKEFEEALRDLRTAILSEKNLVERYKQAVLSRGLAGFDKEKLKGVDSRFSPLLKKLLDIASNIANDREFKNFLLDISSEVGEALAKLELSAAEADQFLKGMEDCLEEGVVASLGASGAAHERYVRTWARFLSVIREAVARLYLRRVL